MPYIITTHHEVDERGITWGGASRHAVATLDEAREAAHGVIMRAPQGRPDGYTSSYGRDAMALPEAGGTIGPLPNGTVIEVRPAKWREITNPADWRSHQPNRAEILSAFNAGVQS